jgi:hypothetical protein
MSPARTTGTIYDEGPNQRTHTNGGFSAISVAE